MSRRRAGRLLAWGLVVWLLWPAAPLVKGPPRVGLGERLLGPFASLSASVVWVRFDLALRDGEPERAYALAERALSLDPGAWQGWQTLGMHLIFDRGSAELAPEPAERRRWIEAGLGVLGRGAEVARHGAELELLHGLALCGYVAPQAAGLGWPGGAEGSLEAGVARLAAASARGHRGAADLLAAAQGDLATLRRGEVPAGWGD